MQLEISLDFFVSFLCQDKNERRIKRCYELKLVDRRVQKEKPQRSQGISQGSQWLN